MIITTPCEYVKPRWACWSSNGKSNEDLHITSMLPCYSHPYLWQRVLDNITKHGKKVGSHRNVVSQKNATHILEGPCHKWWGIEERKNREEIDEQNQSGANEFPGTYHEKAWTWEHRSHWENWGREKQRKTTAELHEKPQPAVKNQWSRKNKKPGGVENHDRQRPNWIRHLERERESYHVIKYVTSLIQSYITRQCHKLDWESSKTQTCLWRVVPLTDIAAAVISLFDVT